MGTRSGCQTLLARLPCSRPGSQPSTLHHCGPACVQAWPWPGARYNPLTEGAPWLLHSPSRPWSAAASACGPSGASSHPPAA
eukprot:9063848-Lingulodinium_polyedra.AAC.1